MIDPRAASSTAPGYSIYSTQTFTSSGTRLRSNVAAAVLTPKIFDERIMWDY